MAEDKREGDFDPGCVTEIYNTLTDHNFALRAFGALLRSSNLAEFADQDLADRLAPVKNTQADNLRWGLSQLIELYLGHQEQVLSGYVDQYHKSDVWLTKRAADLISMVDQGAFISREVAANNLREAVSNLDIVISRGGEMREKAEALKETCMGYIRQLRGGEAILGLKRT